MKLCYLLACLLVLGSCASAPSETAARSVFDNTRLLVLGEIHGTQEAPRFALDTVRASVAEYEPVVLCLEIDRSEQARIERYLASAGSEPDKQDLLAGYHWQLGALDGRGSVAMVELIEGVRQLAMSGSRVSISCFVGGPMPASSDGVDPEANEKHMARGILDELTREPHARVVVLVGNAHAATSGSENPWLPMGYYLKQQHPEMVSLDMRFGGGEAWCFDGEPGVHPVRGDGAFDACGIDLTPTFRHGDFSGVFDLGRVTASMPALPESAEEWIRKNRATAPQR